MPLIDPNFALFVRRGTEVDVLVGRVDLYDTEEHRLDEESTQYPIESGATLTDHAYKLPEELRLTGWVADLLPAPAAVVDGSIRRSRQTWDRIVELQRSRTPVEIATAIRTYTNMLLVRAIARVDRSTGQSLRFELHFRELLFGDTETARLRPGRVSGPATDRTTTIDAGDRTSSPVAVPSPVTGEL